MGIQSCLVIWEVETEISILPLKPQWKVSAKQLCLIASTVPVLLMLTLWFHIYGASAQQPLLFKLSQTSAPERHLFFFYGKYQCEVSKHSGQPSAPLSWALSAQSSFSFSTLNKLTTDKLFHLSPLATVWVMVTHSCFWPMAFSIFSQLHVGPGVHKTNPGCVSDSERQWISDRSRRQSCRCLRKAGRRLLLWGTGPQPPLWDNIKMNFTRDCKQMV